jgi:hypothetical protein
MLQAFAEKANMAIHTKPLIRKKRKPSQPILLSHFNNLV